MIIWKYWQRPIEERGLVAISESLLKHLADEIPKLIHSAFRRSTDQRPRTYEYKILDFGNNYIRLLALFPGDHY